MSKIIQNLKIISSVTGLDPRNLFALRFIFRFLKDLILWKKNGGRITKIFPVLVDYKDSAGTASGHYFHQDLLVAGMIFEHCPERHIDVGSRIDGFVAHLASFRQVEVLDVRPMPKSEHANLVFKQANLMESQGTEITDSLSCLHAIEHFGLGRYGDPIVIDGDLNGIKSLIKMIRDKGRFYISFPVSASDEVYFNAHRVYNPCSILQLECVRKNLKLIRFDLVDDQGNLNTNVSLDSDFQQLKYGCGIYTFEKNVDDNLNYI